MSEFSETENTLESQVAPTGPTRRKLRSKVWNDFTFETKDGSSKAMCKHCNHVFVANSSDGTNHLICHIRGCLKHPHQDLQQSLAGDLETFKFDQEISRKAFANMIIIQEYPFRVVDHPAFREFIKTVQPMFNMLVPYQHSGLVIFDAIEGCIFYWNLKDKLFAITLDNCTTNDVVVEKLEENLSEKLLLGGNHFHMRCCAHILNTIVQAGLKVVHSAIERVRELVKYVKPSPSRMQVFNEIAQQLRVPSKKGLVLDCNLTMAIATILDPRYGGSDDSEVKLKIYLGFAQSTTSNIENEASSIGSSSSLVDRGTKRLHLNFNQFLNRTSDDLVPQDEDGAFDILCCWKLSASKYHILSKLARDILAIPLTGGRVLDQYRSSLHPATVEALMCVQDWLP
ncbi:hypothetical protein AMTRI_Chr10g2190 [Amborella trichopoda]